MKITNLYLNFFILAWSFGLIANPPNKDLLKLHNSKTDCWIEIENEFYNITDYLFEHQKRYKNDLTEWCGKDASKGWETKALKKEKHSRKANRLLEKFKIPK